MHSSQVQKERQSAEGRCKGRQRKERGLASPSRCQPSWDCVPVHNLLCCKVIHYVDCCPHSYGADHASPSATWFFSLHTCRSTLTSQAPGLAPVQATRAPPSEALLMLCLLASVAPAPPPLGSPPPAELLLCPQRFGLPLWGNPEDKSLLRPQRGRRGRRE